MLWQIESPQYIIYRACTKTRVYFFTLPLLSEHFFFEITLSISCNSESIRLCCCCCGLLALLSAAFFLLCFIGSPLLFKSVCQNYTPFFEKVSIFMLSHLDKSDFGYYIKYVALQVQQKRISLYYYPKNEWNTVIDSHRQSCCETPVSGCCTQSVEI